MPQQNDKLYMRRCFELAARGAGAVSPNPLVGAVLVKDGVVIGESYHQRFGGPHAEVYAFEAAVESPEGATLYVNLEPCSHFDKKTPPCAQRVIREKVARVVVSNLDPNPKVNGKGLQLIREAGINVQQGILQKEGALQNRFFFKQVRTGLPWVTVKIARTADGFIASDRKQRLTITGPEAQQAVHALRSQYDAVLIGAGTVSADDPRLTVRRVSGRNPQRVIIDGNLSSPQSAALFHDDAPRPIIFCSDQADPKKIDDFLKLSSDVIPSITESGDISLQHTLQELAKRQINSVLVEGGQIVFTRFLENNLADEVLVFESGESIQKGIPAFNKALDWQAGFELFDESVMGADRYFRYLRKSE